MVKNNRDSNKSHLDNLLADKPPEFQAKVLRFALDSGIKQNDPAFRLVEYIGYLAQLTETAPGEWKQLFNELQQQLNQWSQTTAQHLQTSADHSQEIRHLATNCDRLSTTLSVLDLTSKQQLQQMETLAELLTKSSKGGLKNEMPALKENLNQFKSNQQFMTEAILEIQQEIHQLKKSQSIKSQSLLNKLSMSLIGISNFEWNWGNVIGFVASIFIFWLASLFWAYTVFNVIQPSVILPSSLATSITKIDETTDYNYTKLSRIEKALGTDPHQKRR